MSLVEKHITRQLDYADGQAFGDYGAYQCTEFDVCYAVNPLDSHNSMIVDIEKAPRNQAGLVEFRGQARLIAPVNQTPKALLVDVPNRGRVISFSFNRPSVAEATTTSYPVGDGFLWNHGFALLSIGWQPGAEGLHLNVPEALAHRRRIEGQTIAQMQPGRDTNSLHFGQGGPVMYQITGSGTLYVRDNTRQDYTLIERNRWRFGRVKDGELTREAGFISLAGGFRKGQIYTLVYDVIGASVVGLGLLAMRDAVSHFRYEHNWNQEPPHYSIAYGASQTGRFLRHFLHENLNQDEHDRIIFDAVIPHIAGGQRGDFNHRFAQPGSMGVPSIGQRFPFSTTNSTDSHSGETGGALDSCEKLPKILNTNTSWEYWRGDASLIHVSTDGKEDLSPKENERIYMFAGTHHINAVLPLTKRFMLTGEEVAYPLNSISFTPLIRAVLINALKWVVEGIEPPDSEYPRLKDGTLVDRATVIEAFGSSEHFTDIPNPDSLTGLWFADLGDSVDQGIAELPATLKTAYPAMVSSVSNNFNESAGIQLPEVSIPIGIHSGWNPRSVENGAPDQTATFAGFSRYDIPETVPVSEEECRLLVEQAVAELIERRLVLKKDRELVIDNAMARFEMTQKSKQE